MVKRRVSGDGDSDDDFTEILSSTKRPRVDNIDDEQVREEETKEDEEFEATFGGKVMASIEARQRNQGRIAEYGIVQSLELQNFMCHERLSFSFGPQINFVVGNNGSGKSAVLTALTIALGGKAATTGRGSGLKSFIKSEKTWAEITVTLKNEGSEAYKSDLYGKSIVVTRNFTRSGSSSYKIKSKDGKTVSTKREELENILDHMNIQVDNPLNVLSQDTARHFLSKASAADKYEFFLKGTQLKQLSEEYETILENIGKTNKILDAKKEALPELKRAVKEAQNRLKAAQVALQTRGRVTELKYEQAWAHVAGKENEMKAQIEKVAKRTRKLPKLQDKVDAAKKAQAEYSDKIVDLENLIKDLGNIDHLTKRKTELGDALRANKAKLREYMNSEKEMTVELNTAKATIDDLKARIDSETKKLQEDKKAEQEERQRKLDELKQSINDHEASRNVANEEIRRIDARLGSLKLDIAKATQIAEHSHSTTVTSQQKLKNLGKTANFDRVTVFGPNLREVISKIEKMTWHGERPVGPLGAFVSLRDKKWIAVLSAILGSTMSSFAVTDARDRGTLRKLLVDNKCQHVQVVVAANDIFDYSGGEPKEKLTVLRALQFDNSPQGEYVKRIFINNNRIERTLLATTRAEAQRLAEDARGAGSGERGGAALSADLYRVIAYSEGGSYSQPIQALRQEDPRATFFAYKDPREAISFWKDSLQKAKDTLREAEAHLNGYREEKDKLTRERATFDNQVRRLENQLFQDRQSLRNLQNQHHDDIPVNIASLEDALQEAEETRENIIKQYGDLAAAKEEIHQKQKPLLEESNKIKAQIDDYESKRNGLNNELIEAAGKRSRAQAEIEANENKLRVEQAEIGKEEAAAQLLQNEYEAWTKQAEEFCDGRRVEHPRPLKDVERDLKSVEEALRRQERENGASVEELEEALAIASKKHQETQSDLKKLLVLNRHLKQSVIARLHRWHDFRRHIALRTKLLFQNNLANRAYTGKVLFDHERQRLELKVQTDDTAATQGLNKDPKSLSGGEKSYSTICLLMALWEAIGCPIRCLDEFDVFMDAVNRKVSMQMMIETANASDSKQYILITPQDTSAVSWGPSVRVHRMTDPERGQRTLNLS